MNLSVAPTLAWFGTACVAEIQGGDDMKVFIYFALSMLKMRML